MLLSDILTSVSPIEVAGATSIDIADIATDSRQVKPRHLFIAVPGTQVDGHDYIARATAAGATAVLCERMPESTAEGVTYVRVASTQDAVGHVAHHFFGRPTEQLDLVGVTGTNGKTTTATLLYRMFTRMGYPCGLLSTVCNYVGTEAIPTDHTTPDPITLCRLLARMVAAGCQYAFMEVSSHSVVQQRIGGLRFRGGIFTNLTRDHLDYHKTFDAYRDAKQAFFTALPATAFAVTNADDANGSIMVQNTRATRITYSMRDVADHHARILEESFDGMSLDIDGHEVFVQFVGRFNVYNLLAVYSTAVALGAEPKEVLVHLSTLRPVNGRLETIRSKDGVTAIVDYAHTPDALDNVLQTIGELLHDGQRCITVCGAGGNRDRGKRPLMAQSAVRGSQQVIITSDNPRFEEPEAIIADMLAGLDAAQRRHVLAITDRREAIRTACTMAQPGDVVLIAGKGHEDYQEVRGVKHHFDDHEVVRDIFGL